MSRLREPHKNQLSAQLMTFLLQQLLEEDANICLAAEVVTLGQTKVNGLEQRRDALRKALEALGMNPDENYEQGSMEHMEDAHGQYRL